MQILYNKGNGLNKIRFSCSEMLLVADIGNSTIKFAVFGENSCFDPICKFSIANDSYRSADEYELLIRQMLDSKTFSGKLSHSAVSSVAPSVTVPITNALANITSSAPFIIGCGTRTGFKIRTDDPGEFGADMVCNVAAALELCEAPAVVADLGTATTLAVINSQRELIGSIIIPGAELSLEALSNTAELLNKMTFKHPSKLVGTNTSDSIISGVINGSIYMIDGFIRNLREQLCKNGEKLSLIATGGLNRAIIPYCRNKFSIVEDLTLSGAAILYSRNRKQSPIIQNPKR